jgi:hypothetical protein
MNYKKLAVSSALALTLVVGLMIFGGRRAQAASTWYVAPTGPPSGTSGGSCTSPSFNTISLAIGAASSGDTIRVCVGTYNEQVTVDKTLTLLGAQAGSDARTRALAAESIINNTCSPVRIIADNVVLDGFTVQGSTMSDPCTIAGIWMNPGSNAADHGGAKIRNNVVQNNITGIELDNDGTFQAIVERNLFQNNNNPGPGQGNGIQVVFALNNALIDSNKFSGNISSGLITEAPTTSVTISNNEFAANGGAIALFDVTSSTISTNNIHNSTGTGADVDIAGGNSGLSVTCNNLASGAGRAIQVENPFAVGPNANVTINNNNMSGYPVGLEEDTGGYTPVASNSLDATKNWWGSSTGPTIASNPGGTGERIIDMDHVVKYSPFLTTLSSCAPVPQIGPPTNKDQCKNGGWQTFNTPRTFKNQGDCIQFVNTGK